MGTAVAILILATAAAGDAGGDLDRRLDAKVSLHLRGARLNDALEVFRSATGLNFVAVDGADMEVSIVVTDLSTRSTLRLLLAPRDLTAVFEDGAVVIRKQRGLDGGAVLRIHDVRALQVRIRDFPAPRLDLNPAGGVAVG
jgi:hypothetical protein